MPTPVMCVTAAAPTMRLSHPPTGGRTRAAPGPPRVRVLLLGDQLLTREALAAALAFRGLPVMDLAVPRSRRQLAELTQASRAFAPEVGLIVLEQFDPLVMGDLDRLMQRGLDLRWVVLTACEQGPYWGALLGGGADDVLPVSIGIDALLHALPAVVDGDDLMDPAQRASLGWRDQSERAMLTRLAELSPRQAQVLRELVRGRTVAEVASSRDVSVATVRSQVHAIRDKLQVPTQLAAVAEWIRASRAWPFSEEW